MDVQVHLLDANVLIALILPDHVHHHPARDWFDGNRRFATCPSTQSSLVRALLREDQPITDVVATLGRLTRHRHHQFWPDDASYDKVDLSGVIGHRQVTDAYLADQARRRGARLATFDRGLAALHPDVVELVPV